MISVLLIWIYMIITIGTAGLLTACLSKRLPGYRPGDPEAILLSGLVFVTVYAEVWSLFGKVGIAANICLCVILAVCVFIFRRPLTLTASDAFVVVRSRRIYLPVVIVIMIVMAYGASHGMMHYDTGLYHAQAVRWIEEFGSVPGLANLHTRLGYNSSAFVLNALYSFAATGQSYHVTGAFCALLLACECVLPIVTKESPLISISGFCRVMGLYYLFTIFDEMVSPASDYYMVCLAFILIIRWISASEKSDAAGADMAGTEELTAQCAMLSFLAAFILTVKLSGALFILLAVIPGVTLLRSHRIKEFALCILAGIVTICPYLIRNAVLSGWLLYPSTTIDLFGFDWKVPVDIASYDYKEIQVYGRGYTDVARFDDPVTVWFPDWLRAASLTDRILICAAIVGVVYFVIKCICYVCLRKRDDFGSQNIYRLYTEGVVSAGFLFWLLTSPLMRYGCLYVYLCDAVIWGGVLVRIVSGRVQLKKILYGLLALLLVYKSCMLVVESARVFRSDTWIRQQDYDTFDVHAYELTDEAGTNAIGFYAPDSGDCAGYDAFPSSPWDMDGLIVLRGNDISDGFKNIMR